jgi:hypothetical protein
MFRHTSITSVGAETLYSDIQKEKRSGELGQLIPATFLTGHPTLPSWGDCFRRPRKYFRSGEITFVGSESNSVPARLLWSAAKVFPFRRDYFRRQRKYFRSDEITFVGSESISVPARLLSSAAKVFPFRRDYFRRQRKSFRPRVITFDEHESISVYGYDIEVFCRNVNRLV